MTDARREPPALSLERFLRELPSLDVPQLLAVSAAHDGIGQAALERARARAASLARAEGVLEELQALHGTIVQWAGAHGSLSRLYTREGAFDNTIVHVLHDVREQARPALLDAATALFLGDRLPEADRDALLGPVEGVLD